MATRRESPRFTECQECGAPFEGQWRADKRYCDASCRLRSSKRRRGEGVARRGEHWQAEHRKLLNRLAAQCSLLHKLEREYRWHELYPDRFDRDETQALYNRMSDLAEKEPHRKLLKAREYFEKRMATLGKFESWDDGVRKWPVAWDEDPSLIPGREPFEPDPPIEPVTLRHFTRDWPGGIQGTIVALTEPQLKLFESEGWQVSE